MNQYLYKAKTRKRVGSLIIDLFVMFTLFTVFFSFVFSPIFSSSTKIDYYEDKIHEIKLNSHLYIKDKEKGYVLINDNFDKNITTFYLEFDYDDIDKEDVKDYLSMYETRKAESDLFDYSQEKGWSEKKDVDKDGLSKFYNDELEIAEALLNKSKTLNKYSYNMISLRIIVIIISLLFTYLFYNLIIPLIMKKGQTLGRFICGLAIVDQFGYNVKYKRMVLRCFVGLFFNVVLAIFFAIPWFISITMLIFSKNAITIQDYFSLTYVVDVKESTLFNSKEEQEDFEKKNKNKEFKYVHQKGY